MLNPVYTSLCSLLLASNTLLAEQPTKEWLWHKTSDGQHPNGEEQTQIWLMNRARQNPAAEGRWLATENDLHVSTDRWIYNVDIDLLQAEFAGFTAKPPAAFDVRLYRAAAEHNQHMLAANTQTHNGQQQRANRHGLNCKAYHGNVFAYAKSALHAHVGYNIDWGNGRGGMQNGRLHRLGIMSLDGTFTHAGIASLYETNSNNRVGPWITTGNYCQVNENHADHFSRFIVGTVWEDKNTNGRYDPDEGQEAVTIIPDRGDYFAVTSAGGGYAIPVTEPGTYQISFSGNHVNRWQKTISINKDSQLLDYLISEKKTATSILQIQYGEVTVDDRGISIPVEDHYTSPLALLGPPSRNGRQPVLASMDNRPDRTVSFRTREWNYLDQIHKPETVPYLLIDAGSQTMIDGSIWEADSFSIQGTNQWQSVVFQTQRQQKPYLFLTLQTHNGNQLTTIRVKNHTHQGFQAALFEQELFMDGHKPEIAAYLAIFPGDNNQAIRLPNNHRLSYSLNRINVYDPHANQLPGGFMLEEETSLDAETYHLPEIADILKLGSQHSLAQITSFNDPQTVSLRKK